MRPFLALSLVLALAAASPAAATKKALFDNTHAETAGNADWQIDTDQPLPLPDQSTVTADTPRTYWLGAISSWAIDLVKRGYSVATLTSTYGMTFGNAANPYDLSNFDVLIVDEPNTLFSAAESTAIFNFVRDGGGLIMVVDHWNSDRNSDGWDSPEIWNALDAQKLWGIHCGVSGDANINITQNSGNVETALDDSIIHGPIGVADSVEFHNGTTMTLYPANNAGVRGEIWMNGLAHGSTTGLMAARSVYGNGRIFIVGDSSPADDGSAAPGNSSIFDGWGEASGRDSLLFMNATLWATRRPATVGVPRDEAPRIGFALPAPNPGGDRVTLRFTLPQAGRATLVLYDLAGRRVRALAAGPLAAGEHVATWDGRNEAGAGAAPGLYLARLATPWGTLTRRVLRVP
jgi:hypothetical protein